MVRKIIHIDMDAFFASIEQRDNPELRGKPVAVGHGSDRGVVAAASYEARKFGVYSAMPSVVAKRKCPNLIFVPPRFHVYKDVSAILMSIFREYTNLVEPLSIDEAFLDVTTNKRGIQSATLIAREIKNRVVEATGLTASAGISINKFLAKIASDQRKPDGLFVIKPNAVLSFIETLPVEKFYGVGPRTSQKMHELGLFYGKDIREADLQLLIRCFGKVGSFFHQVAHGIDQRPVVPHRVRKSVGIENTFLHDLEDKEQMLKALSELEEELWPRIVRHGRFGRTITLKVKFSDFEQITRSQSFLHPITERATIHGLVIELLKIANPTKKVRLLGITMSNFEDEETTGPVQLTIDFD
ncbi:MAG: DNA polymerase IV [Bacteroidales bacterium]|nr:DNA polymerase IV [Bacteroidales bacterium]